MREGRPASAGAARGRLLAAVVAWLAVPHATAFNLEPQEAQVFDYPYRHSQGRDSYFGFAVGLQKHPFDNTAWLLVGAPRANSSQYAPERIDEPGAVFKCRLFPKTACSELYIDPTGNEQVFNGNIEYSFHDLKNRGWLGGAIDIQPSYTDRQATAVCAPRWKNQKFYPSTQMNGACYWFNHSLPNAPAHKMVPLVQYSQQTFTAHKKRVFFYAHGEAGLALHFPDEPTEMVVGAPGVFNWRGSVIRMKDFEPPPTGEISRRRRQLSTSEVSMFSSEFVPNPYYTPQIRDFDLFGYAVTSGRFRDQDKLLYAAGAPRGGDSLGKVLIFDFPERNDLKLKVEDEWVGEQMGENFGAALTAADVNGDGLSDLVVGAPMYSLPNNPDVGRVQVYLSSQGSKLQPSSLEHYGSHTDFARFGTTLANLGDLNNDGYQDVAVGAPWEGAGAVYVFLGSAGGLRATHSQRLVPDDFQYQQPLTGFGMSLSRGTDVDSNGYPDVAIGSFLSGHVVVVRSRPVVRVFGSVKATPSVLALDDTALEVSACFDYTGHRVPPRINLHGNLTLDQAFYAPRAAFTDTNTLSMSFEAVVISGQLKCETFGVTVKEDKLDPREPLLLRLHYQLHEDPSQPLLSQPLLDPGTGTSNTSLVSIVTGCEDDGDETCRVDLNIEAKFLDYETQQLVIGTDTRPKLQVAVYNTGEPAFLPNVTLKVAPPLSLLMPSSHNCLFPDQTTRTSLVCRLSNPIPQYESDTMVVEVDAGELTDAAGQTAVEVTVGSEGIEVNPNDNGFPQPLSLAAQASVIIHGYSKDEQIVFQRLEDGSMNTSINPSVIHSFTLVKSGPTPLGEVQLVAHIPHKFTNNDTFVRIYAPKTKFLGQPFSCELDGGEYTAEDVEGDITHSGGLVPDMSTHSTQPPPVNRNTKARGRRVLEELQSFNCTSGRVKCVRIICLIGPWSGDTSSAELSIKLGIDMSVLADHININTGGALKSAATATIRSLNPNLTFLGDKLAQVVVQTQVQPDSLALGTVPWWVIMLAVLAGLVLLGLVAYGLYKGGFFKRKEMEEMKAQRARVESSNAGATNAGMVGD